MNNNFINKVVLIAEISAQNKIFNSQVENLESIVALQKSQFDIYRQQIEEYREMTAIVQELKKRN
jgi:hypothetical protein